MRMAALIEEVRMSMVMIHPRYVVVMDVRVPVDGVCRPKAAFTEEGLEVGVPWPWLKTC
jgi:hypothetical protein